MGDAQRAIPNHQINPVTGFIESPGFLDAFDSNKKLVFIDLYKQNGLSIYNTCEQMHLGYRTLSKHMNTDAAFKEAVEEAEREYADKLQAVSRLSAMNPKSTVERIFQLNALYPSKYKGSKSGSETNVTINIDAELLRSVANRDNVLDVTPLPQNSESPAELSQSDNAS